MLCPKCGYNSFDYYNNCPKCKKDWKPIRRQLSLNSPEPGQVDFFAILGHQAPSLSAPDLGEEPPVFTPGPSDSQNFLPDSQNFIEADIVPPPGPPPQDFSRPPQPVQDFTQSPPLQPPVPPRPKPINLPPATVLAPPSPPPAPPMAPPPPVPPVAPPPPAPPRATTAPPPPPPAPPSLEPDLENFSVEPLEVSPPSSTITPVEVDVLEDGPRVQDFPEETPMEVTVAPEAELEITPMTVEEEVSPTLEVSPEIAPLEVDLDESLPPEPIFETFAPEPTPLETPLDPPSPGPQPRMVKMEPPENTAALDNIRSTLIGTGDLPKAGSPDPTETFMVQPGSLEILDELADDDTHSLLSQEPAPLPSDTRSAQAQVSLEDDLDFGDPGEDFDPETPETVEFDGLDELDDD